MSLQDGNYKMNRRFIPRTFQVHQNSHIGSVTGLLRILKSVKPFRVAETRKSLFRIDLIFLLRFLWVISLMSSSRIVQATPPNFTTPNDSDNARALAFEDADNRMNQKVREM